MYWTVKYGYVLFARAVKTSAAVELEKNEVVSRCSSRQIYVYIHKTIRLHFTVLTKNHLNSTFVATLYLCDIMFSCLLVKPHV